MSAITAVKPSSLEQEFTDDVYILTSEEERMIEEAEREPCISAEEAEAEIQAWFQSQEQSL